MGRFEKAVILSKKAFVQIADAKIESFSVTTKLFLSFVEKKLFFLKKNLFKGKNTQKYTFLTEIKRSIIGKFGFFI